MVGVLGIIVILGICFMMSNNKKKINGKNSNNINSIKNNENKNNSNNNNKDLLNDLIDPDISDMNLNNDINLVENLNID